MRSALRLAVYFLFPVTIFAATLAFAQQPAPSAEADAKPGVTLVQPPVAVDDKFVRERFGDQFTLVKNFPGMLADLDGDGVEDLVIVAKAKSPMLDEVRWASRWLTPITRSLVLAIRTLRRGLARTILHARVLFCW